MEVARSMQTNYRIVIESSAPGVPTLQNLDSDRLTIVEVLREIAEHKPLPYSSKTTITIYPVG